MINLKYDKIYNVVPIVRRLMKDYVKPGDMALDCTIGNGNDTLLLAKLVGPMGRVYGFDIQEKAIENTKKLLKDECGIDNIILIKDSHEYIDKYINENLDFIIYNLGYLPGGDKNIKTCASSTVKSIKKSLKLLRENGIICVTVYPGHNGGRDEKLAIDDLFSGLDQRYFNVLKHEFINQKNNPPILYVLEKAKLKD